jgi:hypothetical protein
MTSLSFIPFIIRHLLNLYTPAEKAGLERSKNFEKGGMGHYHLMTTKPQTFGYFLADSPVGLLAWMYEKLHDWSDGYQWTDDEVCMWVSIYWFSKAGPAASARLYYESLRGEFPAKAGGYIPDVKMVSSLSSTGIEGNMLMFGRVLRTSRERYSDCRKLGGSRWVKLLLSGNMRKEGISLLGKYPRVSLEISRTCLGRVEELMVLWRGKMDMLECQFEKVFLRNFEKINVAFSPDI